LKLQEKLRTSAKNEQRTELNRHYKWYETVKMNIFKQSINKKYGSEVVIVIGLVKKAVCEESFRATSHPPSNKVSHF
jgi:hypothetical protein